MGVKIQVEIPNIEEVGIPTSSFGIGEAIENIIYKKVGEIEDENKILKGLLLNWCMQIEDVEEKEQFAKYFNIKRHDESS